MVVIDLLPNYHPFGIYSFVEFVLYYLNVVPTLLPKFLTYVAVGYFAVNFFSKLFIFARVLLETITQKISEYTMKRPQTIHEERLNAFSHFLGILFCLIAIPIVLMGIYDATDLTPFYSVLTFGLGMLLVYSFSTLYHAAKSERIKDLLQIADHISIYFLIAGTYTPLMIRYLDAKTSFIFLTVMWSIVAVGVVFKVFFTKRFKYLSVVLYLSLGWMLVFVLKPLLENIPMMVLWWIIAGGLSYTTGVYFYMKDYKLYYHTVWHIFVLFGTFSHFISVWMSF